MDQRSKVRGVFLGVAIGDALGMPVETFSAEKIAADYGRVTTYLAPTGHKWFDGESPGTTTDDTQLTLAVAEAMIEAPFDMEAQVKWHVVALKEGTKGWGRSTKDSIRRIANGGSWQESGNPGGAGNGVAMKVAPLGLAISSDNLTPGQIMATIDAPLFLMNLAGMTHRSMMAIASGFVMASAVEICFSDEAPEEYLISELPVVAQLVDQREEGDRLSERLDLLANYNDYSTERMIEEFGGGSCYVYNSLPFSLMHFLRNPHSIESLYDVVSAGGDTDTNGSIVGALLGALNGEDIFPQHLKDGLLNRDKVLDTADRFFARFFEC